MTEKVGTPIGYMSPEMFNGNYGLYSDIWSAGCVMFFLLCGYELGDDRQFLKNIHLKG